jgi:hypothetical protein
MKGLWRRVGWKRRQNWNEEEGKTNIRDQTACPVLTSRIALWEQNHRLAYESSLPQIHTFLVTDRWRKWFVCEHFRFCDEPHRPFLQRSASSSFLFNRPYWWQAIAFLPTAAWIRGGSHRTPWRKQVHFGLIQDPPSVAESYVFTDN